MKYSPFLSRGLRCVAVRGGVYELVKEFYFGY